MKAVILISGRGSNMQALLEANLPVAFACVISSRPDAAGLAFAAGRGVATAVVDHKAYPDRAGFDAALAVEIERHAPDLVILAGFMRVLTDDFVRRYQGRMINIHPALLPAFGGPGMYGHHVHEAVVARGARVTGATVHFVDEEYDHGPIIAQWPVPVFPGDDADTVARRVLAVEHALFPRVVQQLAAGVITLGDDGRVLGAPGHLAPTHFALRADPGAAAEGINALLG